VSCWRQQDIDFYMTLALPPKWTVWVLKGSMRGTRGLAQHLGQHSPVIPLSTSPHPLNGLSKSSSIWSVSWPKQPSHLPHASAAVIQSLTCLFCLLHWTGNFHRQGTWDHGWQET
jgi:hypothetical protein